MSTETVPGNNVPCGYEQLACDTAQPLTVPTNARWAYFRAQGQTIRIRDDGTDPSATVGFPLLTTDGNPFVYVGNLRSVRAIAAVAGGLLNILYYS